MKTFETKPYIGELPAQLNLIFFTNMSIKETF